MHPDLLQLSAADAEERALKACDRAIVVANERLEGAKKALTLAEVAETTTAAALAALRDAERQLQREIEGYRANRLAAVRMLESGVGNADAAERQRQRSEALIDEAETRQIENLEAQDPARAAYQRAAMALDAARKLLAVSAAEVPEEVARQTAAHALHLVGRDAALVPLDPQTRQRYLLLVQRKGTAVAAIRKECCASCQITVYQQHLTDIRRGLIEPCKGCGRWLVPAT